MSCQLSYERTYPKKIIYNDVTSTLVEEKYCYHAFYENNGDVLSTQNNKC